MTKAYTEMRQGGIILKLTSYGPKVKKYKSILLKLVLLLYYLCLPVKIYYIHMYTTVTDLVNIYI